MMKSQPAHRLSQLTSDPSDDELRTARRELLALASQMEDATVLGDIPLELTSEFDSADESSSEQSESAREPTRLYDALGESACRKLGLPNLPSDFRLSVVMPVFNEHDTIERIIDRVFSTYLPIELVIVDDGSNDGTSEKLGRLNEIGWSGDQHPRSGLRVLVHATNRGKGAALRTGFAEVSGEVIIIQDADEEYDPQDYFSLLTPIVDDRADIVYGSRFQSNSESSSPGWHRFGNRMITRTSNLKTGLKLTDVETCYKMFRRQYLQQIAPTLRESGFGIELEMSAKLSRIPGIRIVEVPISYCKRTYAEGKKIGWKDGLWAMWCILRY